MPRTAKDVKTNNSTSDKDKDVKKTTKKASANSSNLKKSTKKSTAVKDKKTSSKKASVSGKVTKKATTKKTTTKKVAEKKVTTKKATTKKASTVAKKSSAKSSSKVSKLNEKNTILEYYDLPYRYNQTIVKILAQTPSTLFVYWDISDIDRTNFIEKYGDDFFNKTRPILLIHNKTKNNYSEVEINDFANSWYLRMQEPDCEYDIELGRRNIENPSQYIYVSSSNQLVSPNDHVLFDETDFTNIRFKNVKTGSISQKDFGSIRLMTSIGNIYNKKHKVYRFYNDLYKDEVLDSNKMFYNPSSNPTSNVF